MHDLCDTVQVIHHNQRRIRPHARLAVKASSNWRLCVSVSDARVCVCRAQITEGVQQRLRSHASLTVKDAAEALAATSFLQQLTSIQV